MTLQNIFTRIKNSISADLHQFMDKKEEKNPIAALNNYLRQSEQEKEKVRKLLERHYKLQKEFAKNKQTSPKEPMKKIYTIMP